MEVRPGYKQTEIGVIPEEWELRPMATLLKLQNGVNADKSAYGHGIPFINVLEVITYPTLTEARVPGRIAVSPQAINTYAVEYGDVLFNRTSETEWEIGLASVYTGKEEVVFGGFVIRGRPQDDSMTSNFAAYALRSPMVRAQIVARGQGGIRTNIGQQDLSQVQVPLPKTKAEQESIAAALSDVNALTESLEQLLAKKRNLKRGTMQELLTGKKRLPGFGTGHPEFRVTEIGPLPMDWPIVKVKDLTKTHKQGYYTKDQYVNAGVKLVRITDLHNPQIAYAEMPMLKLSVSDHELYRISIGDFLFARSGAIGRYGIVYNDVDAVFGSYIIRFSLDSLKVRNEYFGYLYETEAVLKQLLSITQGSSNININASNIKSILMPLPDLDEQTAIVAILSDMDAEIASLETKLVKARELKQGMMQALLTGRIRLV